MSVATLLELLELLPPPMGTGESNKFNQEEIRKRTKLDSERSESKEEKLESAHRISETRKWQPLPPPSKNVN